MRDRAPALVVLALLVSSSCSQPASEPSAADAAPAAAVAAPVRPAVDVASLADRLVTEVAAVKAGELVQIAGGTRDAALLERLATSVRKAGASPLVTLQSDAMLSQYFADVPANRDTDPMAFDQKLAEVVNVLIQVDANEDESLFAKIDPQRVATVRTQLEPVLATHMKRGVRVVQIGNGMYPTAWRARRLGLEQDELTRTFWSAVNVDYAQLQQDTERMRVLLAGGKQVHVTTPDGTDIRMRIDGRPMIASDGTISADDIKRGGPSVVVYLPAGEVFGAPVPQTGEGTLVAPREIYNGQEATGVRITFAGGKVTSMSGSGPGFAALKADYDAAGAGKDIFGPFDIGINRALALPRGDGPGNFVQAGMVTLGFGGDWWAGGTNTTAFGWLTHLKNATVRLDDKVIVQNGELVPR